MQIIGNLAQAKDKLVSFEVLPHLKYHTISYMY